MKILAIVLAALAFFWIVVIAVFERLAPKALVRWYRGHVGAPLFRGSAGMFPGWAVIETTGRRTGKRRLTPVGARRQGDTIWVVAGHDWRPDYLYNIEANPDVRVRTRGRWHEGRASLCPEDDARRRAMWTNPINGIFVRIACANLVTLRVDLEPRR